MVLVMELTHRLDPMMMPALLAAVTASWTARLVDSRSIYSARAQVAAAPVPSRTGASVGLAALHHRGTRSH